MPLVLIVVLAGIRESLIMSSCIQIAHCRKVKLAIGLPVVAVGLFLL